MVFGVKKLKLSRLALEGGRRIEPRMESMLPAMKRTKAKFKLVILNFLMNPPVRYKKTKPNVCATFILSIIFSKIEKYPERKKIVITEPKRKLGLKHINMFFCLRDCGI